MDSLVINQTQVFLIFIVCGGIIGVLFDIFRILRKVFKTPDLITYIEDVIFWLLTCIFLAYTIFKYNNGELRLFIFIGLFIGITLYILLVSKFVIKTCVKIINLIKLICQRVIKIIRIPINIIISILKRIINPICKMIKHIKNSLSKFAIKICKILAKKDFSKKDFT